MYDFYDGMGTIGIILGFFLAVTLFVMFVALLIAGGTGVAERYTCKDYAKLYAAETHFSWASGCYIKKDGQFIPRQTFDKLLMPNAQYGNAEFNMNIKKD